MPRPSPSTEPKKLPSRLQKQAPAMLQLDPCRVNCESWENGPPSQSPIPLLSPLIVSPDPLQDVPMDADVEEVAAEEKGRTSLQNVEYGVWRHPALSPMVMMEPASLLPLFQAQCGFGPGCAND